MWVELYRVWGLSCDASKSQGQKSSSLGHPWDRRYHHWGRKSSMGQAISSLGQKITSITSLGQKVTLTLQNMASPGQTLISLGQKGLSIQAVCWPGSWSRSEQTPAVQFHHASLSGNRRSSSAACASCCLHQRSRGTTLYCCPCEAKLLRSKCIIRRKLKDEWQKGMLCVHVFACCWECA